MNILVVGRGWVGRKMFDQLVIEGHTVTLCPHHKVEDLLLNHRFFDWVVNCAGLTGYPNVDACEDVKQDTMEGNAIFPIKLQEICESAGMRFAHFSSGCIYEGNIDDRYADPNFFGSTYSLSKGVSDLLLKDKCLLFRVRLPFDGSHNPKNLLQKLYNYAKSSKLVEGGLNSITDIDEAVGHAVNLIEQDAEGPFNLVNWDPITTHEIADMMELNCDWWTTEEFKQVTTARRSNCVIPAYERMSPVKVALTRRIAQFKENL
jgi:dTDP-4-dehydrorhamnose reductase